MTEQYRYIAECPRCSKTSIVIYGRPLQRLQCTNCLMRDVEIADMILKPLGTVDNERDRL
jgi:ribosomal protein S27E